MAASYRHKNNDALTSDILFHALRIVIEQHSSLSIHTLVRPSPKKEGNHRAWRARLKSINLEDCTSFIDDYDDSELSMQALFQKTHNEWFDLEDRTRPLWRLIVVNHVHVLFVWQHLVCDGIGGIAFHKSLLAALNKVASEGNTARVANTLVKTSTKPLPTNLFVLFQKAGYKSNVLATVSKVAWLALFRLWYGGKSFFFDDATYSKKVPTLGQVKDEDRCVTSVKTLRLSPVVLEKCLAACKKNKTTFGTFLATVIDVTLATDVYPLSKARMLAMQVDLRRYLPHNDDLINMTSSVGRVSQVHKYREAGQEPLSNHSRFWKLAQEYNHWLQDHLSVPKHGTPIPIQDSLLLKPADEETFAKQVIANLGFAMDRSYTISNLGAVDSGVDHDAPWEHSAMEFSCCATKPCIGWLLYFAVISLKGGECVINVSYEKGAFKDEHVQEILEKIEQRLISVL